MAFWDRFRKKEPQKAAQQSAGPKLEDYTDLRVELTAQQDGRLLFAARIDNVQGDEADLYQYTDSTLPEDQEITEPIPVYARGFLDKTRVDAPDNMAVTFTARILPMGERMWKAHQVHIESIAKGRAYFRLEVKVPAFTAPIRNNIAGDRPCQVINISVGGACIATDQTYRRGDRFLLKVKLMPSSPVSRLYCEVLRITDRGSGTFEYGCRFVELDDAARTRISQDILSAQLAARRKD